MGYVVMLMCGLIGASALTIAMSRHVCLVMCVCDVTLAMSVIMPSSLIDDVYREHCYFVCACRRFNWHQFPAKSEAVSS